MRGLQAQPESVRSVRLRLNSFRKLNFQTLVFAPLFINATTGAKSAHIIFRFVQNQAETETVRVCVKLSDTLPDSLGFGLSAMKICGL
jgi:hypothetical protein